MYVRSQKWKLRKFNFCYFRVFITILQLSNTPLAGGQSDLDMGRGLEDCALREWIGGQLEQQILR